MASLKDLYPCSPSLPVEIWCQIIEGNSLSFCETCQIWNTIQHCSDCTTLICKDCTTFDDSQRYQYCSKCASERWCPTLRRINPYWKGAIGEKYNCDYYTESSSCSSCHYFEECDKCEKKVCCRHSIKLPYRKRYMPWKDVVLCIPCTQCLVQEQLQYKTSLP